MVRPERGVQADGQRPGHRRGREDDRLGSVEDGIVHRGDGEGSGRLPGRDGLPIVERLLNRGLDRDDPYLPLMLWWAVEARALTDVDRLVSFFGGRAAWADAGLRQNALRLVRRYAAEGTAAGYEASRRLLAIAPGVRCDITLASTSVIRASPKSRTFTSGTACADEPSSRALGGTTRMFDGFRSR